jgi:hypothetical protein
VEPNLGLDDIDPGWHVLRFEIDPVTMTFSYIVDGQKVGSFVPKDSISDHFVEFKQSNFHVKFAMNNFGPSKAPVGYIDYIRMGAIEDDLVRQEPFVMAVGLWEATDLNDKSHMTLSVERVSKGQYAFLYRDEQANVCKGGSGTAGFEANTTSNSILASIEFICDSPSDLKFNVDFKLTYDQINDQIVDSYGVVWHRVQE